MLYVIFIYLYPFIYEEEKLLSLFLILTFMQMTLLIANTDMT